MAGSRLLARCWPRPRGQIERRRLVGPRKPKHASQQHVLDGGGDAGSEIATADLGSAASLRNQWLRSLPGVGVVLFPDRSRFPIVPRHHPVEIRAQRGGLVLIAVVHKSTDRVVGLNRPDGSAPTVLDHKQRGIKRRTGKPIRMLLAGRVFGGIFQPDQQSPGLLGRGDSRGHGREIRSAMPQV